MSLLKEIEKMYKQGRNSPVGGLLGGPLDLEAKLNDEASKGLVKAGMDPEMARIHGLLASSSPLFMPLILSGMGSSEYYDRFGL